MSSAATPASSSPRSTSQIEQRSGESDEAWWDERSSFWEERFDPERYAVISRLYADGGYEEQEEPFAYGLARLLDGVEAGLPG